MAAGADAAAAASTPLVILGASGRMGTSLLRALPEFPQLKLKAALVAPGSTRLGQDSGLAAGLAANGIPLCAAHGAALQGVALQGAGLAIDFSAAAASPGLVAACAAARVPLLLGTTGHAPELGLEAQLEEAARRIPVLLAANTSLGVTVLMDLVRRASCALGEAFDVQIQETHHRAKRDAPSGTALALGAAAAEGRGGSCPLGYASLRGGDVVGDHEVHFLGAGERLVLSHRATDRSIFARGALRAGCWLLGRRPGLYGMADLLGEK